MKKKICIFTGTRAEYGLLKPLIDEILNDGTFELQLLVSGMHLSPEFGLTYKEIEQDGLKIDEKVEILLSADTPSAISKSIGLGLIGYADALNRLKPDMVVILGDRFEALAFAIASYVNRIPIAHLYGGEATWGTMDEGFRNSITKLAYLHFTSTEQYRKRVIQLGEHPDRVFNIGALGIDNIKKLKLLSKEKIERKLKVKFKQKNILVTYHPSTLDQNITEMEFGVLLNVLEELEDTLIIFTKSNADMEGRIINKMIDEFCLKHSDRAMSFTSLGRINYLSILQFVDAVVGNSSSGIIEAPSFKIGTINIGDRQKGRIKAESIIDCEPTEDSIKKAFEKLYSKDFQSKLKNVENPYGDGNSAKRILSILKDKFLYSPVDLKKSFYEIDFEVK